MRRTTILSALALTLSAVLAGMLFLTGRGGTAAAVSATAGAAGGKEGTLLDKIPQRGKLRVCTTGDYRPFTYLDPKTGDRTGIDVDMARHLAGSLGVQATFVPTTWATIVDDLAANKCDVSMGGVSVTLARARKAYFSTPYITDGKAPIARCADKDKYQTLEQIDLPGVRVIVNPGGTNQQFVQAHIKKATVITHPDNNSIHEEIAAGRADVMITDASETRYQAKIRPELCAINPDKPFTFAEKAYLLPRGDEVFKEYVDQWLHLSVKDGTYARYAAPWQN
jgi:cyclohexadienyl dehydratase